MTNAKMDPVTLAILKGRLEQIADEMDKHMQKEPIRYMQLDEMGRVSRSKGC